MRVDEELKRTRAELLGEAEKLAARMKAIPYWGTGAPDALETLMMQPGSESFLACNTANDGVCLIGFTSGATSEPTGTMHFHRVLATCNSKSASRPMPGFRCNRISSS